MVNQSQSKTQFVFVFFNFSRYNLKLDLIKTLLLFAFYLSMQVLFNL